MYLWFSRTFSEPFLTAGVESALREEAAMLRPSVKRDQFGVSPYGIVHKPTDAAFTPDPADPFSGIMRLGHLGNGQPNGIGFKPDDVCRLMDELWVDYVANNPRLFGRVDRKPN